MPQARVNQYVRACRAWPLLTASAANRLKVTYARPSGLLRIHPRPIRFALAVIQAGALVPDASLRTAVYTPTGSPRTTR
jgi:hypothetical protein